jgi:hypothetical protein
LTPSSLDLRRVKVQEFQQVKHVTNRSCDLLHQVVKYCGCTITLYSGHQHDHNARKGDSWLEKS